MPYIGNQPAESFTSFATQEFSTSATTSYTLDHAVTNENEIALFINNVRQQPGSGKAYTATGTALTLSAATASTDTMYCVFLGRALQTVNPAGGSIGSSQLSADAITGQTALTAEPDDTDEFLVSDAGTLKRIDYSLIKGGGRFTLVSTGTISGGATYIDLDDVFTATYKNYLLVYTGVDVNTDGADLHIQVKTSSGLVSGGSDYVYAYGQIASNNNISSSYDTGNSYYRLNNSGVGNAATESASGTVLFYEPRSTSHYHLMEGHQVSLSTGVDALSNWSVGAAKTTTALTGLRFKAASGNLDAGVLKLYGAND